MSLKMKSILTGGVLILILILTLFVLLKNPQDTLDLLENVSILQNDEDSSKLELISNDSNLIQSVTVKNKSDEFVIEKLEDDVWGIDELKNFNLITNYSSMLETVSNLTAVEVVEVNSSNLSDFGFDQPNIIIDIVFSDSRVYQIQVGDISHQTNTAYVIIDNSSTVYRFLPSTFSEFLLNKNAFISTNVIASLPKNEYGNIEPNYSYMRLERFDLAKPWVFEKYQPKSDITLTIPAYLQFSSPVSCDIDAERFPKYFENYFGLSALSVEAFNPSVDDLIKYGFDDPYAKFTTIYDDSNMQFTLIVGNQIPTQGVNSRYLMLEDTDLVYTIETSRLPFLTVKSSDIISSMLVLESVDDFSQIDISIGNNKLNFEIWHEDDVAVQDNDDDYYIHVDNDDSYLYKDNVLFVNLNGNSINPNDYTFYIQSLFLTSAVDITDKRPTGSPDLSIKYQYLDDSIETVDVYIQSDRTTILVLNKTDYFVGRSGYVENILQQTEYLLDKVNI